MSASNNFRGVVAMILVASSALVAQAQNRLPFGPVNYTHDFQPFETFDIRNFTQAPDPHEGFFFTFDKVSWAVSGEHVTIGNPNVVVRMPDVLRNVLPPLVQNGIMDTAPEATFGWGERYEFGHIVDHHGWTVGILDGPDVTDVETFGFNDEILSDAGNDDNFFINSHPASGNVFILFDSDPNALLGFFFADSDDDGIFDQPFDLDGDGALDLDDLVTYVPSFDQVEVRNNTSLDGVELMRTYRFKPTQHGSFVEFSFGARYLRLHDNFRVDARGGILNDLPIPASVGNPINSRSSFWDTTIDNHIIGPQVAMKWSKRRGRFTFRAGGRFTFGYNVQDHDQNGQLGTALQYQGPDPPATLAVVPPVSIYEGVGQPIYMANTAFRHGKQEQDFSPLVEFRTETSYHLTQHFALKLGFNATFIDNIQRAAPSVLYSMPKMGFRDDVGTQEIFTAGVNLGAEFNR